MKLKHYFALLAVAIALLAGVALFATSALGGGTLFYVTEGFIVMVFVYLWYF